MNNKLFSGFLGVFFITLGAVHLGAPTEVLGVVLIVCGIIIVVAATKDKE